MSSKAESVPTEPPIQTDVESLFAQLALIRVVLGVQGFSQWGETYNAHSWRARDFAARRCSANAYGQHANAVARSLFVWPIS